MTRSTLLTSLILTCGGIAVTAQQHVGVPKQAPGTRVEFLSTIQGNTLTSSGGRLTDATVRLRDVRRGHVIETQTTDKTGAFVFKAVDPGNFIVEVIGSGSTVMAATQILSVNAGQVVSTVVRLPFQTAAFAGVLGNTTASATAVTSQAAASGILATAVAGEPISPGK